MSIASTFTALGTLLLTANPTPQPQLTRVITNLVESHAESDRPFAILGLARDGHTISIEAMQLGRIDYVVEINVILGGTETPLIELHDRAKYWPLAILTALSSDVTLGGTIAFTGGGKWAVPFTVGPLADYPEYWGLTFSLPVTEKPNLNGMG